jgi:hypothetical protein
VLVLSKPRDHPIAVESLEDLWRNWQTQRT